METELLTYPEPDSDAFEPSDKSTQLVRKLPTSHPSRGQPHQPPNSSSDTHAAPGASAFQSATREKSNHPTSQQNTREQNPGLNGLPSQLTDDIGRPGCVPRRVPEEDDDGEGSTEHHAKLVAPGTPFGKEVAKLEHGRLTELEQRLSETHITKTEQDERISQLTKELARSNDEFALKSALLEQAEANAAEEKKRAGLELCELQAKLDELLLSRDHALEQAEANAAEEKKRAGLELCELQAKLDESLLSRDHALEQAESNAAEEKKHAGVELRELQAELDESLLSRNHAREQAQSALQKASSAAEAYEQSQRELTEMRAKLEASRSESAAFRLRLADTEDGCAKSKTEGDIYHNLDRNQTTTGRANADEDRVVHRLKERVRALEAEISSLRWNEKSFDMMECRNEG